MIYIIYYSEARVQYHYLSHLQVVNHALHEGCVVAPGYGYRGSLKLTRPQEDVSQVNTVHWLI